MLADLPDGWQAQDIAVALSFVSNFGQAVDCGAHRGTITAQLCRRFFRVIAIEPGPLAQQIQPPAVVINVALGKEPSRCSMRDGPENTGQRHCVPGEDVPVIPLDALGLHPDFVKIDVEGMERDVLLGGADTIRNFRPVVMIEENGLSERYGVPHGAAGALLEEWGAKRVAVRNKDWIYAW